MTAIRRTSSVVAPSPIFYALVVMTLGFGAALANGLRASGFMMFLFVIAGWVLSLALHEFGHAVVAYIGGDRSVVAKGYLTLDVRKYVDVGTSLLFPIFILIIGGIGLPGGRGLDKHQRHPFTDDAQPDECRGASSVGLLCAVVSVAGAPRPGRVSLAGHWVDVPRLDPDHRHGVQPASDSRARWVRHHRTASVASDPAGDLPIPSVRHHVGVPGDLLRRFRSETVFSTSPMP